MKRVVLTPLARSDLRGIWLYTNEHWGAGQADDYTDAIEADCQAAAAGAGAVGTVAGRGDLRRRVVRSHVVYFRDLPDRIEVIRILHSRQDPDLNLGE